ALRASSVVESLIQRFLPSRFLQVASNILFAVLGVARFRRPRRLFGRDAALPTQAGFGRGE
ncbi:MAG TPA: hypothetical protein VGM62_07935, partial [Chthoniobacterales bacterium]